MKKIIKKEFVIAIAIIAVLVVATTTTVMVKKNHNAKKISEDSQQENSLAKDTNSTTRDITVAGVTISDSTNAENQTIDSTVVAEENDKEAVMTEDELAEKSDANEDAAIVNEDTAIVNEEDSNDNTNENVSTEEYYEAENQTEAPAVTPEPTIAEKEIKSKYEMNAILVNNAVINILNLDENNGGAREHELMTPTTRDLITDNAIYKDVDGFYYNTYPDKHIVDQIYASLGDENQGYLGCIHAKVGTYNGKDVYFEYVYKVKQ